MKILLVAGALTLAVLLVGGHLARPLPTRPLDDLRWQRDLSYSSAPYATAPYIMAKIGRPDAAIQVATASSTLQRR